MDTYLDNKKGISLIELLGYLIISTILLGLTSMLLFSSIRGFKFFTSTSFLQREALSVTSKLVTDINEFYPSSVDSCGTNCVILYDNNNDEMRIEIINNDLLVDNKSYLDKGYHIDDDSSIDYIVIGGFHYFLELNINFVDDKTNETYEFYTSIPV